MEGPMKVIRRVSVCVGLLGRWCFMDQFLSRSCIKQSESYLLFISVIHRKLELAL